ncbi:MAG TPA: hypothetical protein VFX98_11705 [Longimicrobiaceae bacterium]|nr:hypothetical protein [Longimicrobiaceae bacterium]
MKHRLDTDELEVESYEIIAPVAPLYETDTNQTYYQTCIVTCGNCTVSWWACDAM